MSQNDIPDFDSFQTVDPGEMDSGAGSIDLDPGENYVGEITDVDFSTGDHGILKIDGKELWLNATMRKQIEKALIEGEPVAYFKSEEVESFEDDGEEIEFNPRELRFLED